MGVCRVALRLGRGPGGSLRPVFAPTRGGFSALITGHSLHTSSACWRRQGPKPYRCSTCSAEVPDLPMPDLKHQMSHIRRRPYSRLAAERAESAGHDESLGS